MKRILSLLLALCLSVSLLGIGCFAQAAETENEAVFAARALGIMTGDENGNMNLGSNVTRAEFAKMMVAASNYKDSVGTGVGVSLYKDVKSDHWASQYIKLAVEEGWFQGYTDGSFRPSGIITLEEGVTVLLRALGYGTGDLMGSFPSAQLSKYYALGLGDGVSTKQGESLSRQDCAQLFFNLMGTETKAGVYYGTTLGYEVVGGKLNYSGIVNANMKGPYLAKAGGSGIPLSNPSVIKNGKNISLSQIAEYDVYYYNPGMKTVWVYDDKAVGTLSAVSPNTAAPESVTVGGITYALSTSEAMFAVSDLGSYKTGDTVTLLLDKKGSAAFVISAQNVSGVLYGVVLSSTKESVTVDGSAKIMYSVKIACTDGIVRSVNTESFYASEGSVVTVKYSGGAATITGLSKRTLYGKFTGEYFGSKKLASDVKIIDVLGTNAISVYPERLKGYSLSESSVLYYELNSRGEIEHLILNNATGDAASYAYIISAEEFNDEYTISGRYRVLIGGQETSLITNGYTYGAKPGGAAVAYKNGEISSFSALSSLNASSVTQLQVQTSKGIYQIADGALVYLMKDYSYQPVSLSTVLDSSAYSYTAWVDSGSPAGNRVRILIAYEK